MFPAGDAYEGLWRTASGTNEQLLFGEQARGAAVHVLQADWQADHWNIKAATPAGEVSFTLHLPGRHNVSNALAALACTLAAGAPLEAMAQGLSAFRPVKGRSRALLLRHRARTVTLVDDTYNANPDSVKAAIEVLSSLPGRKILILGDMGEIGRQSAQYHDEVGGYAKSQGIDTLFALGEASARAASNFGQGARHFKKIDEMITAALKELKPETTILVKGSRFMRMERVVDALILHPEGNKHAS